MKFAATLVACVSTLLLFASCQKANDAGPDRTTAAQPEPADISMPDKTKPPAEWTANEILKRLLANYRQAKTYRDNAVVRLAFRQTGQPVFQEQPFAVAYERPDKLSVAAFQATVKSNGTQLKAR